MEISSIKCTPEEYEDYIRDFRDKRIKLSLIVIGVMTLVYMILGKSILVGNIIFLIVLAVVGINIDIEIMEIRTKKSLEDNYILVDRDMIIYYTNIFKLRRKLNKTYHIKKIVEIKEKMGYNIVYGNIDMLRENVDGTEERREVEFCRVPKYYKNIGDTLERFKNRTYK